MFFKPLLLRAQLSSHILKKFSTMASGLEAFTSEGVVPDVISVPPKVILGVSYKSGVKVCF